MRKAVGKPDIDANHCFPFNNAVSIVNSLKTYQQTTKSTDSSVWSTKRKDIQTDSNLHSLITYMQIFLIPCKNVAYSDFYKQDSKQEHYSNILSC